MRLSYLNLFLAAGYFLLFLQGSGGLVITGLLLVVAFALLSVIEYRETHFLYRTIHYISALQSALFAIFLSYSAYHVTADSAAHAYYSADSLLLTGYNLVFGLTILIQLVIFIKRSLNN
ncbi:MAG: hypothetical protein EOO88_05600 [Pedobacter sp.]|nr:MAG: hypothetical protein EOO88_05600 [Pedobacter sp.]